MRVIYTEIVVEGDELLSGKVPFRKGEQRDELIFEILSSYFSAFEDFDILWVERFD